MFTFIEELAAQLVAERKLCQVQGQPGVGEHWCFLVGMGREAAVKDFKKALPRDTAEEEKYETRQ